MGHIIFFFLHIVALASGGFGLLITIPLHLIYSAASKPKTLREDGKKRNNGILGSLIDDIVVNYKMKDCPYCKKKIMKDASKCPYCQSALVEFENNNINNSTKQNAPDDIAPESNPLVNERLLKGLCVNCGKQLGGFEKTMNSYCKNCKSKGLK